MSSVLILLAYPLSYEGTLTTVPLTLYLSLSEPSLNNCLSPTFAIHRGWMSFNFTFFHPFHFSFKTCAYIVLTTSDFVR